MPFKFQHTTQMEMAMASRQRQTKAKLPKTPKMKPPLSIEREYARDILQIADTLYKLVQKNIYPILEGSVSNNNFARGDAVADDLDDAFGRVKVQLTQEYSDQEITRIATKRGMSVSAYNEEMLRNNVKRVVGVDVFFGNQYLDNSIAAFSKYNTSLIKSMTDTAIKDTEGIVYNALRQGLRASSIEQSIAERLSPEVGSIKSKAKLIARDQVSKLNAELNMLRQQEIGITGYIWNTVGDESVRPTHAAHEGKEYEWDKPPADTGHPGDDINCRCIATPNYKLLLK